MNSATLTEAKGRLAATAGGPGKAAAAPLPDGASRVDDGFHAWHFFVLASILLATVAVFMTRRSTPENLVLLSFTIAAAGLAAGALYRMLIPLTVSDLSTLDQPMTDRYRATLERDKALTLRTIKELEFDHAMRKLSKKDFDEMSGRLRQRALALMKQLDEGRSYAPAIEQDLQQRLRRLPLASSAAEQVRVQAACACGAINDDDAVFCKKCGTKVAV
jgi:hypothetical protein